MDWLALHAVHAGSADEEWNSRFLKWSFMSVAYASSQLGTLRPRRLPRTCHQRQFLGRMRFLVLLPGHWGRRQPGSPQRGTGPNTIAMLVAHYRLKELATDRNRRKAFSTKICLRMQSGELDTSALGDHTLDQVKSVAVEEWLDGIKRAKGARAKIRNLMSALFTHAMRYEWADRNPIKLVRQSAKRERIPDVLELARTSTPAEQARCSGTNARFVGRWHWASRQRTPCPPMAGCGFRQPLSSV